MKNYDNKFIGTFDTETEVLRKIEELKQQGYAENDMYVMSSDENQISMVRGRTDVDVEASHDSWMDKFMNFLSGETPTRGAFDKMGLDAGEADRYYNEVKSGKILLYVDRDYGDHYEDHHAYVDDAAVASPGLTVDTNESNDTAYNTNRNLVENDDRLDTGRIDGGYKTEGADEFVGREDRERTEPILDADRTGRVEETDEERLRLHEERLNVNKEEVQTGEVNVGKHTVEEHQTVEVPVEREEVVVERRPVNEETTDEVGLNDRAYDDNEEIHIPLKEERVEVNKKDVVAEEIVVGKRKVKDTEKIDETVRHEEADIEEDVEVNEADRFDRDDKGRL
ncbi:YsnF/AvaK domain-containing protein [Indiicoccus explosivorum]|uniref:YsnF/AvaK domain-containing protein n=1 Tax=Indiicoccus explosivorum TaxID=1917864 RepID=UPI000B44F0B2|nr:YsnF/AvaK domain-containing protein [Indiicoccus explosivorum]